MKHLLPLPSTAAIVGALALLAPASSQAQFEGVLTAKMNSERGPMDVTHSIKGDKMRMDMTMGRMGDAAMIVDKAAEKSYMLMPQRKMYMENDLSGAIAQAQSQSKADFKWDGTSQTIAGTKCDDATSKEEDGTVMHMCIAKGIAFHAASGGMGRGAQASAWQRAVQGGFPLKVQREGESQPLFEVTKLEKKSLGDDLFTPPAGWQKLSMPMGMPMGRP